MATFCSILGRLSGVTGLFGGSKAFDTDATARTPGDLLDQSETTNHLSQKAVPTEFHVTDGTTGR
jgi:hypothetical protein